MKKTGGTDYKFNAIIIELHLIELNFSRVKTLKIMFNSRFDVLKTKYKKYSFHDKKTYEDITYMCSSWDLNLIVCLKVTHR